MDERGSSRSPGRSGGLAYKARVSGSVGGYLLVVLILAFGTFAVGTDAFIVAGFLPTLATTFGVSVATAEQSVTVFALTYAVLAPILATLTARVPRRSLLVGALSILGSANLVVAVALEFTMLVVARALAAGRCGRLYTYGGCGGRFSCRSLRTWSGPRCCRRRLDFGHSLGGTSWRSHERLGGLARFTRHGSRALIPKCSRRVAGHPGSWRRALYTVYTVYTVA